MSTFQYYVSCKLCNAPMGYDIKQVAKRAERDGISCRSCRALQTAERRSAGLTRNCPSCNDIITYSSGRSCREANKKHVACMKCASNNRKSIHYSGLTRNCPSCNVELTYSSTDGATMANRLGTTCKSCSLKGQVPSPQCLAAALKANTGIKRTEEHMAAIIAANTGIIRSAETRLKMSISFTGRVYRHETRQRMSESAKHRPPISDITRAKHAARMIGTTHTVSQYVRDRVSAANLGRVHTSEARFNMKTAQNARYGREPDWKAPYTVSELRTWGNHAKAKTPYCEKCNSTSDLQAHHIKPKCLYPELALDISNARVLCHECHKNCHRKTWIKQFLIDRNLARQESTHIK